MVLTTNRIEAFDTAFKSRVHLAIKYPSLSQSSQKSLWLMFLTNDSKRSRPSWLSEQAMDKLADERLNGRRIKNVARTATALAIDAGRELELGNVYVSLVAMKDFEQDFAHNVQAGRGTDAVSSTTEGDSTLESEHKRKRPRLQ